MVSKNYAQLLFNAVRETLETMAFAEVIPCSIRIGDEEFDHSNGLDDFVLGSGEESNESSEAAPEDAWGTVAPTTPEDPWGTPDATTESAPADDWGTPAAEEAPTDDWGTPAGEGEAPTDDWGTPASGEKAVDDWGEPGMEVSAGDNSWGESGVLGQTAADPWGDAVSSGNAAAGAALPTKEIDFNDLVENQDDWVWSCMRVNSPEINAVWFIVSKDLAFELARNMYAGEDLALDSPLIRDLVAELTNVLGGRLMLLLENLGGKFTLTVPEIGVGFPQLPDNVSSESVLCRVLVDGEYPVIVSLAFNKP